VYTGLVFVIQLYYTFSEAMRFVFTRIEYWDDGLICDGVSCGKVRTDKLTSTLRTIAKSV